MKHRCWPGCLAVPRSLRRTWPELDIASDVAETAITLTIVREGSHAFADLRVRLAAEQERQNRSFAALRSHYRARCAAQRYRYRSLFA